MGEYGVKGKSNNFKYSNKKALQISLLKKERLIYIVKLQLQIN